VSAAALDRVINVLGCLTHARMWLTTLKSHLAAMLTYDNLHIYVGVAVVIGCNYAASARLVPDRRCLKGADSGLKEVAREGQKSGPKRPNASRDSSASALAARRPTSAYVAEASRLLQPPLLRPVTTA
jgi:hypothetical protein